MSAVRISEEALAERMQRSTLRAREAAAYIGCSYWKLLELRKAGRIPFCDLDGLILFRKETLDQFLAEREAASMKRQERQQDPKAIRRLI